MERSYWLGRKRASVANAAKAQSAVARLIHLDLAGRYSVRAAVGEARAPAALRLASAAAGDAWYEQLDTGTRWFASGAAPLERSDLHPDMSMRYARLRGVGASMRGAR